MTNAEIVQRLAEIHERLKRISDKEWHVDRDDNCILLNSRDIDLLIIEGDDIGCSACFNYEDDAIFCASATQDIPWLLERIKEQEAEVASVKAYHCMDLHREGEQLAICHDRIAALENACRICENCIYYPACDSDRVFKPICNTCFKASAGGGVNLTHWEFNEKKFSSRVEGIR